MSKRKRNKIAFVLTFTLIIILFFIKKDFHAKFYNKTGHDLDSLVIGTNYVGHLAIDDSTDYLSFRKFLFDGGQPYESISGVSQQRHLFKLNWSWCGTSRKSISKGSYKFDIKTGINKERIMCLYLVTQNGQIFTWQ